MSFCNMFYINVILQHALLYIVADPDVDEQDISKKLIYFFYDATTQTTQNQMVKYASFDSKCIRYVIHRIN